MADAINLLMESLIANWQLLLIIIFGVLMFVPWALLFVLNFFNGNIIEEIKATFNRRKIKLFKQYQNGQGEILYKEMKPEEKKIIVQKGKEGLDETIIVTSPPIPDRRSHRQMYITIEGQEGTKDLLRESKYDVNTPQKRMAFSMYFELGREYERAYSTQDKYANFLQWAQLGIPMLLLIILIILTWSQNGVLSEIAKAVGV